MKGTPCPAQTPCVDSRLLSRFVIGPVAARKLFVEQFEPEHGASGSADHQALGDRRRAADVSDQFSFASAQEPALPRAAIDLIADDASAKGARVRTNSGGIRR
jgi:hypothetical protein